MRTLEEIKQRVELRKSQVPENKKNLLKLLEVNLSIFGPLKKKIFGQLSPLACDVVDIPVKQLLAAEKNFPNISFEEIESVKKMYLEKRKQDLEDYDFFKRDEKGEFTLDFLKCSSSKLKRFFASVPGFRNGVRLALKKSENNPVFLANVSMYRTEFSKSYNTVLEDLDWLKEEK